MIQMTAALTGRVSVDPPCAATAIPVVACWIEMPVPGPLDADAGRRRVDAHAAVLVAVRRAARVEAGRARVGEGSPDRVELAARDGRPVAMAGIRDAVGVPWVHDRVSVSGVGQRVVVHGERGPFQRPDLVSDVATGVGRRSSGRVGIAGGALVDAAQEAAPIVRQVEGRRSISRAVRRADRREERRIVGAAEGGAVAGEPPRRRRDSAEGDDGPRRREACPSRRGCSRAVAGLALGHGRRVLTACGQDQMKCRGPPERREREVPSAGVDHCNSLGTGGLQDSRGVIPEIALGSPWRARSPAPRETHGFLPACPWRARC